MRAYRGLGRVLSRAGPLATAAVRDLQRDLRALGYHDGDISGLWGARLDGAVRAIRHDLTHPGDAPVIAAYNAAGAVGAAPATGSAKVEPALAERIAALADDGRIAKLPASADPQGDNRRAWQTVRAIRDGAAPTPFVEAIFRAESDGRHFQVPTAENADNFVTVVLHRDDAHAPDRITSRGYGLAQRILPNHPPDPADLARRVVDPLGNARGSFVRLRAAFDTAVVTPDPARRDPERAVERPLSPLRLCKYEAGDARFLADCHNCAMAAQRTVAGAWPGGPDRADFPCDWPYATRRATGEGPAAFAHQARVLSNLLYLT